MGETREKATEIINWKNDDFLFCLKYLIKYEKDKSVIGCGTNLVLKEMETMRQLKDRHLGDRMCRTQPPIKWGTLQGSRNIAHVLEDFSDK